MTEINTQKEEGVNVLTIDGDVDASSSIFLDEELERLISAGEKKILIDCSNLEYISSAGLGVFMSHLQETRDREIKLILFGMSEKVKNIFDILGLDQLLIIENEKSKAIEAVNEL